MITIQTLSDWNTHTTFKEESNKYVVVFFVSPGCGACQKYQETLNKILEYSMKKKKSNQKVDYLLFDVTNISKDKNLKSIVNQYEIRSIPTILLFEKSNQGLQLKTKLKHRSYLPIEEWIQSKWYPNKKISEMLAMAALYEINNWTKKKYKEVSQLTEEETQKQILFGNLIHNFENKYLDEYVLLGWIPQLFTSIKDKKKLQKIAYQIANVSESSEWKNWIQQNMNQNRNHKIELSNISSLPKNEKVRNFLIKELYHFLLKNQVEILLL
jgi:thiol-disulfide isomerase/thioredoxin